jgi:hypothetical protein
LSYATPSCLGFERSEPEVSKIAGLLRAKKNLDCGIMERKDSGAKILPRERT